MRQNASLARKFNEDVAEVDPLMGLEDWILFYERHFPAECRTAGGAERLRLVPVPEGREGFEWLILVIPGLSLQQVYAELARHFKCWRFEDDLDLIVTKNDRSAIDDAYAIRVRSRIEADEEFAGVSASQLAHRGVQGITLLERMLLELKYWDATREHLDCKNDTLCSGSQCDDGHQTVPDTRWYLGVFSVGRMIPDAQNPIVHVREVIS